MNDHSTSKYTYLGILMLICTVFGGYAVATMYITRGQYAELYEKLFY
jgi:hypothetical protein